MADDINVTAPANDQPAPPTGEKQEVNSDRAQEALEWEKLTGDSQDRFKSLLQERNQYKDVAGQLYQELEALKNLATTPSPASMAPAPETQPTVPQGAPGERQLTAEEMAAIEVLRQYGMLTKQDQEQILARQELTEAKMGQALQAIKDEIVIDNAHTRLEEKYSGKNGEPKYDRELIEEHMKKSAIWDPDKAYQDMYKDELFDLRLRNQKRPVGYMTEKPSGSTASRTEPLTLENVRARLQQPDGREWWERNRERILPTLGSLLNQ